MLSIIGVNGKTWSNAKSLSFLWIFGIKLFTKVKDKTALKLNPELATNALLAFLSQLFVFTAEYISSPDFIILVICVGLSFINFLKASRWSVMQAKRCLFTETVKRAEFGYKLCPDRNPGSLQASWWAEGCLEHSGLAWVLPGSNGMPLLGAVGANRDRAVLHWNPDLRDNNPKRETQARLCC